MMMPFLPASGGILQPTIAQCAPFSLTSCNSGGADGAADGGMKYGFIHQVMWVYLFMHIHTVFIAQYARINNRQYSIHAEYFRPETIMSPSLI